jgi:hypothetical protein
MMNISRSSGATIRSAQKKKLKFTPAELALVKSTPAVPALVLTSQNVQLHNATQIHIGSGSEISVLSSTESQRRVELARAKRELAEARATVTEARVSEAQAELDLSAGSQAGSVGRLNDVRSEGEPLLAHDVRRATTQQTL